LGGIRGRGVPEEPNSTPVAPSASAATVPILTARHGVSLPNILPPPDVLPTVELNERERTRRRGRDPLARSGSRNQIDLAVDLTPAQLFRGVFGAPKKGEEPQKTGFCCQISSLSAASSRTAHR